MTQKADSAFCQLKVPESIDDYFLVILEGLIEAELLMNQFDQIFWL